MIHEKGLYSIGKSLRCIKYLYISSTYSATNMTDAMGLIGVSKARFII